jgi:uncharacterized protein (DUF1800 family)
VEKKQFSEPVLAFSGWARGRYFGGVLLAAILISLWSLASPVLALERIDLNGNGLDDVWEFHYQAVGVDPDADPDRDGRNNREESDAGTDPFDGASVLKIMSYTDVGGGDLQVGFSSEAGKTYEVLIGSGTKAEDFLPEGVKHQGDGNPVMATVIGGAVGAKKFFKVAPGDQDSDGDGVSDWAENQLEGFDANDPESYQAGQSDLFTLSAMLAPAGSEQVGVFAHYPEAFENGAAGSPAAGAFRISRLGTEGVLSVFFTLSASADPRFGQPDSSDYTLASFGGDAATGVLQIADGQSHVDLVVLPVADAVHEFPERLELQLTEHSDYDLALNREAAVDIFDQTDAPDNDTLFVAVMGPERSAVTSASGLATLFLNGKKDRARVNMSFSGLTSIQTASHIHHSRLNGVEIINGPVVESIPLGQVANYDWEIRPSGAYSPQQLINALFRENEEEPLYINAHSMDHPGGEIWGFFVESTGATEFVEPEAPPAVEPIAGDDLTRDVVRFLTQATFGPTQEEVEALVDDINNNHGGDRMAGYAAWIDAQYALDQTRLYDLTYAADQRYWSLVPSNPLNPDNPQPRMNNRRMAHWHIAMKAHDQLRQRVAFALSEILVVSELEANVANKHYGTAKYYDILGDHADGTYLQILRDVSKHPIMAQYLSSLKNAKATLDSQGNIIIAPDENYAREIMQLFSIGLLTLHPDGSLVIDADGLPIQTYDNDDITELAKVFTGWSFSKKVGSKGSGYPTQNNNDFNYYGGPQYFQASWEYPMKNFANQHDTTQKNVLGSVIPAGQNGYADLNNATSILFNHQNAAPFIARLLIQRLVTSNPSAGYIYRVSSAFDDNRTAPDQMKHVIKAILLDYEARSLTQIDNVGYGKQKEPLIRYLQLMRAYGAKSDLPLADLTGHGYPAGQLNNFPADATLYNWTTQGHSWWSQSHLRAPTVFNWFLPGQQVGGGLQQAGLVAPEFTLTNEYQSVRWVNYAYLLAYAKWLGASELPNQRETVANGGMDDPNGELDNIRAFHYVDALEAMVEADITGGATAEEAFTTLIDHLDVLLCAGRLKDLYEDAEVPNPRATVLDQALYTYNLYANKTTARDRAVKDVLYLISTSPEFITQK